MSQPAPAASFQPRSRWKTWLARLGIGLLAVLAAGAFCSFLVLQFGGVHGVEFNPHTFKRRSYSFYEIPLIGYQVRRIRHEDLTGPVEDFLIQQKYVTPPKKTPNIWHIVAGTRGTSAVQRGDAEILLKYLDTEDDSRTHLWITWSEKHPKLAPALWAAVARLAREDLYIYIPELFDIAKASSDPVRLQRDLNRVLASHFRQVAKEMQDQKDEAAAKRYREEAAKLEKEKS